jgi:hypothetical protein
MSDFNDDIARGYLENGEPLEAMYGKGSGLKVSRGSNNNA